MNTDDLLNAPIRQPQPKAATPYGDPVNRVKPSKPKKGDPGWNEAYRRELIALRQLGCFIPDDLFPKS